MNLRREIRLAKFKIKKAKEAISSIPFKIGNVISKVRAGNKEAERQDIYGTNDIVLYFDWSGLHQATFTKEQLLRRINRLEQVHGLECVVEKDALYATEWVRYDNTTFGTH